MEYTNALNRAFDALPDSPQQAGERLSVPDPAGETDGAFTRLTNLNEIADAISRDTDRLFRYIQSDLGTNGQFEDGRARYNGSFTVADFDAAIAGFVEEFVTCSECGLPDTYLVREDGVEMLRCEACGAFRPVQKTANTTATNQPTLEEGKTYELNITGTGRKGDGVANKGKYTIFVSGASEGQTVNAYIKSISGDLAFARLG